MPTSSPPQKAPIDTVAADPASPDVAAIADDSHGGANRALRRLAAALFYRNFRVLWFGACTSSIGTWMQMTAENWLVLTLTSSAFFLGLDSFLQQFPLVLFTMIGGVVADRYNRRDTLLKSQVVQMTSALTLAALVFTGTAQIWHILVLSFMSGCAQAFGGPAFQALIPALVDKDKKDLTNAIALNSIQFNIARAIGPTLAAVAIATFVARGFSEVVATSPVFAINGLSFLVVIVALASLRGVGHPVGERRGLLQELHMGLSYVRRDPAIRSLMVLAGLSTFLGFPLQTLLPVFARDVLGMEVGGFGTLMTVHGCGSIAGALVVAWRGRYRHMGSTTLGILVIFGGLIALLSVARTLWLVYPLMFLIGMGLMIMASTLISLVQMIAPNDMRGRVMSIYLMAFRGGMPLGGLVGGTVADLTSVPLVLGVCGGLLSVVGISFLLKSREVRQL